MPWLDGKYPGPSSVEVLKSLKRRGLIGSRLKTLIKRLFGSKSHKKKEAN